MGSLAERSTQQVHTVLDADEAMAKRVLHEEVAVDELQLEIDDRVVQLLALHQQMAEALQLQMRTIEGAASSTCLSACNEITR